MAYIMKSYCMIVVFILVQLMLNGFSILNMVESATVAAEEISALQDLYISTNGNEWNWHDASYGVPWNFTANCNPCEENWQGVTCRSYPNTASQNIIKLSLKNYNLQGTLPATLTELTKLENIILSYNYIYGTIPTSFTK